MFKRWIVWVAFVGLCLLSASSWAIPREMMDGLPTLEQQGLVFGAIGLIALLFAVREIRVRGGKSLPRVQLAAASVSFFGVPTVVAEYARGSVPAISRAALFAMVPVVVITVLAVGDANLSEERGVRRFLVPALAGLSGLLLLLPLEFSGSVRGRVMLGVVCGAVVLAGLASVWLYRLLRRFALIDAVAVVGLSNGVFLLIWSVFHDTAVWQWSGLASVMSISSLIDVAEILLIVWLLRGMQPVRFAARYLFIPLLTVLESYVVMRPEVTARMVSGTVLLAAGTGMLLFLRPGEEETTLSLR